MGDRLREFSRQGQAEVVNKKEVRQSLLSTPVQGSPSARVLPRLRECYRQVEAEVVSNSSNEIHQTWEALFWQPLYQSASIFKT